MKRSIIAILCLSAFVWVTMAFAQTSATIQDCEKILKSMKITFKPSGKKAVTFKTGFPGGKEYELILSADSQNKFVYLAVVDLIKLPKSSSSVCEITKKMAALNYGMVMAKLEWDEQKGEVRISMTMDTENGLTPKRFATALQTLLLSAEQAEKKLGGKTK